MPSSANSWPSAVTNGRSDKDEAFKLLFAMPRGEGFNYVMVDPPFDSLHSDPRWRELLRHMNLSADDAALSR